MNWSANKRLIKLAIVGGVLLLVPRRSSRQTCDEQLPEDKQKKTK